MANPSMPSTPGPGRTARPGETAPSTDTLKADANAAMDEARNVASKVAAEAGTQASELLDEAKSKVDETTQKVRGMASEQKDLLANQISGVADAVDRVAGDLESNDNASAHYARMLADNAGKLSDTIRKNDVDQILNMAQDFGRRQPVAFLATAALLGFAASRFLTASAHRPAEQPAEPTQGSYVPDGGVTGDRPSPAYQSGRV